MEWISVKDRLPEPSYILVWAPEYQNQAMVAMYTETKDGLGFWDFDEWNDNSIEEYVTHWMPLPAPPLTPIDTK